MMSRLVMKRCFVQPRQLWIRGMCSAAAGKARIPILRDVSSFRQARAAQAPGKTVGFVPTMGALHDAHLELVRRARRENDFVAASVFVNPKQFAPGEDFGSYPRNLDRDVDMLEQEGVDVVFAPDGEVMYPNDPPHATYVTIEGIDEIGEGAARPGFFRGVATVVTKLFNIVQPTRAYFGQKDALQSIVIRRIVRELNMSVEVVICPTVRESDGLAMSSRNVYLNDEQRAAAPALFRGLTRAEEAFAKACAEGRPVTVSELEAHVQAEIDQEPLLSTQYINFADPDTGAELDSEVPSGTLLSLAVKVGKTRLIDNCLLGASSQQ